MFIRDIDSPAIGRVLPVLHYSCVLVSRAFCHFPSVSIRFAANRTKRERNTFGSEVYGYFVKKYRENRDFWHFAFFNIAATSSSMLYERRAPLLNRMFALRRLYERPHEMVYTNGVYAYASLFPTESCVTFVGTYAATK